MGIEEMLLGYTINAAKQIGAEDRKGSIEAGKRANLVVFDEDIFEHAHKSPEDFGDIAPACTYFEGEERHIVSELKNERS